MPSSMDEDANEKGGSPSQHSPPLERENEAERSDSEYAASEHSPSEGEIPKEEDIVYEDVQLEPLAHPFAKSALDDEDTELWLVRMPRHAALRKAVEGSEIQLADAVEEQSSATTDRIAGTCKGYYVYRDHGLADEGMRATFVTRDKSGKAKLQVAKRFAKSVSVTFDVPLRSLNSTRPPARTYPTAPRGQKLKYFPIGSSRGKRTLPPPTTSSKVVSSPAKKRKISLKKERILSPRSTRSRKASGAPADVQPLAANGTHAGIPETVVSTKPRKRKQRIV